MSRVWFTSDLHLGHRLAAAKRGFEDVDEHDEAIAEAWAQVVRKNDQVWVLGDLTVGNPSNALAIIARLPGDKHMVWGNHDQGHPMHRNAHRRADQYLDAFSSAQAFARRRVGGQDVMLSHFPYAGDHLDRPVDRFGQYRLRYDGLPIIHGHTHWSSDQMLDPMVTLAADVRQIHVGVDAHGLGPVSEASVIRALTKRL